MWVPPEQKDPVLLHHPTRKSVGYFGAIRLRDGKLVFQKEEEKFNAVTFHTFLKRLRRISCRTGRRVVVITDNAKYHHAKLHADWRQQQWFASAGLDENWGNSATLEPASFQNDELLQLYPTKWFDPSTN